MLSIEYTAHKFAHNNNHNKNKYGVHKLTEAEVTLAFGFIKSSVVEQLKAVKGVINHAHTSLQSTSSRGTSTGTGWQGGCPWFFFKLSHGVRLLWSSLACFNPPATNTRNPPKPWRDTADYCDGLHSVRVSCQS